MSALNAAATRFGLQDRYWRKNCCKDARGESFSNALVVPSEMTSSQTTRTDLVPRHRPLTNWLLISLLARVNVQPACCAR